MKKKILLSVILTISFLACLYPQVPDTAVLFTVAGEKVTVGEFKYMYLKNSRQMQGERPDPADYLDLYINFKLKVHEARVAGYDTMPAFLRELAGYRKQLAKPYRVNPHVMDSLMKEAYDHMKKEVQAHHILVRVSPNGDTTEAWNKIMEVRKKLIDGVPFEKMARAVSDDPSAKANGGNLGYFTAFQLVYPFEKAVYNLPRGEISMPVRTRYGYHLIRVDTVLSNPGEVEVAHIMVAVPRNASGKARENAKRKIYRIYDSLQKGADFAKLAQSMSDDYNTARNGGKLPWFGPGRMIPEFADVAFSLKNIGDYSEPVKTPYGWHIIKLLGRKPLGTYEEMKPELKKKLSSSDRLKVAQDIHMRYLKKKYHAIADTGWLERVIEKAAIADGKIFIPLSREDKTHIVLRFQDQRIPFSEFYASLRKLQFDKNKEVQSLIRSRFEAFAAKKLSDYEDAHLEEEYPEFASIMKEYREGMLMFNIMDKNIWSRTVKDTAGLKQYYEIHKKNYLTPEKMILIHYVLTDPARQKKVVKEMKKKGKKAVTKDRLLEKYNRDSKNILTASVDTIEKKKGTLADTLVWKKGAVRVIRHRDCVDLYKVVKLLPPQPQPLNQIRGVVTSDYQDYLEKKWIRELRTKYPVVVNRAVFARLEKELK
ncbi:MAG: peptidylprolyl isomerase [Bacteroidales bacterium]|nr:peptidylprolyl isomerase [Bacteroidales bacterium]